MAKNPATRVKTGEVRLSYVHLAEPHKINPADDTEKAKYSLSLIIPKTDKATLTALKANYNLAVERGIQKYGESFKRMATPLIRPAGSDKGELVDGDEDEKYAGDSDYKGCYILGVKSITPPPVYAVEKGSKPLTKEEIEELVYSGCYAKVLLNFYPYNNHRMGITAGLDSVLKTRDGESLGGRVNALDYFGEDIDKAADSMLDENDLLGGDDHDDLPF